MCIIDIAQVSLGVCYACDNLRTRAALRHRFSPLDAREPSCGNEPDAGALARDAALACFTPPPPSPPPSSVPSAMRVHLVSSMAYDGALGFWPQIPREIPDLNATEQAGDVCRNSDGGVVVNGLLHAIALKGSCRKGDTRTTFTFKNMEAPAVGRCLGKYYSTEEVSQCQSVRDPTCCLSIEDVESHV